jgi:hypothetical protein
MCLDQTLAPILNANTKIINTALDKLANARSCPLVCKFQIWMDNVSAGLSTLIGDVGDVKLKLFQRKSLPEPVV